MLKMMLKINCFVAISILLFTSCSGGNSEKYSIGNKTTMKVNQIFDAGTVIKGEVVEAKFEIENTGDYPLVFGAINPSCSCTTSEAPEEPIQPGDKTIIKAYVNTNTLGIGAVNKKISFVANTEPSPIDVFVKVNVVRK
jgi:hypothetical protein